MPVPWILGISNTVHVFQTQLLAGDHSLHHQNQLKVWHQNELQGPILGKNVPLTLSPIECLTAFLAPYKELIERMSLSVLIPTAHRAGATIVCF